MAKQVTQQRTVLSLELDRTEAEVLRLAVDVCLERPEDDPQYEDWDWPRFRAVVKSIRDILPEAI